MSPRLQRGTAVAVAIDGAAPLQGALLLGASGAGKSDLGLRLIEDCPYGRSRLIADDYIDLTVENGRLLAAAPARIAGLIEVRGVGILPIDPAGPAALSVAFDLETTPERMPAPYNFEPEEGGPVLPLVSLRPFEASAAAKVRATLRAIFSGHFPANAQD